MWTDNEHRLLLVILILAVIFGALLLIGGNMARADTHERNGGQAYETLAI